ncbi:MAG: hypothetical protein QOJ96_2861 [Alphaproteobacteria bacterium]|nr:hypothetical protein [Alphaproteobacteria bacterium]
MASAASGILIGILLCAALAIGAGLFLSRDRLVQVTQQAFASGTLPHETRTGANFVDCTFLTMLYVRQENALLNAIDTKWIDGSHPCEGLEILVNGGPEVTKLLATRFSYPNYPFGTRHLESLLLAMLDLDAAKTVCWLFSYVSVVTLLIGAWLNTPRLTLAILPISLFLFFAFAQRQFADSLGWAPGFASGFLALSVFLAAKQLFRDRGHRLVFFGFLGTMTAFFDNLNGPIPVVLSLSIVLNQLFYRSHCLDTENKDALKLYWVNSIGDACAIFFCFFISYVALTVVRLPLLIAFVSESNWQHYFRELFYRMGDVMNDKPVYIMDLIRALWSLRTELTGNVLSTWLLFGSAAAWILTICLLPILYRLRGRATLLLTADIFVIAIAAGGILAWYMAFKNHTIGHPWIMIRLVTLPASYGFVVLLLVVERLAGTASHRTEVALR